MGPLKPQSVRNLLFLCCSRVNELNCEKMSFHFFTASVASYDICYSRSLLLVPSLPFSHQTSVCGSVCEFGTCIL